MRTPEIKTTDMVIKILAALAIIFCLILSMTGCAAFQNSAQNLRGDISGATYTIEFYADNGTKTMTTTGQRIGIDANKIKEIDYDSDGSRTTRYSMSSVITLTIDGHEMNTCGDTVIFAESGLNKEADFSADKYAVVESMGTDSLLEAKIFAKPINEYRNAFGKPVVVVIKSQDGTPICAYSGESVYWEVCDNLPKTTKLMIDSKALYIHRANFQTIDKALIK